MRSSREQRHKMAAANNNTFQRNVGRVGDALAFAYGRSAGEQSVNNETSPPIGSKDEFNKPVNRSVLGGISMLPLLVIGVGLWFFLR